MSALTITHTHETGTLIDGTSRGDGSAPALKTNGWRWGRSISAWYVPQTRDHIAQGWKINQTAEALRAAGFDVEIEIDNTPRATVDVELGKQARQVGRVDALTAQADRKHADAETRWAAADRAHDVLPPGGEPIKVGHHSEGRHRRALDRAHATMGKAVAADADAREADRRLREAAAGTAARNSAITTGNRIDTLAADVRGLERDHLSSQARAVLAGDDPNTVTERPELIQARDQLAYWREQRAAAIDAGDILDYGRHNVKAGDLVQLSGSWYRVRRANTKTVRVDTEFGHQPAPWHKITDHRAVEPSATIPTPG